MSLIKIVLIYHLLSTYFKTLLPYFLDIIKSDIYKLWAGAGCIHTILFLTGAIHRADRMQA